MSPNRRHKIHDFITQESPQKFMLTFQKNLLQDAEVYTKFMLIKAAVTGNVTQLKEIIGCSSKPRELVNSQDLSGCTALHVAARFNQVAVAEVLLSHGADCNRIAWSTSSPLQVACRYEHEKMIRLLLKYGSDPLQKLSGDGNVLHVIAFHSTVAVAELRHGANPRAQDVRLMTPFMVACRLGHAGVMGTLLFSYTIGTQTKTKIISDVDNEGMTALHHAVMSGRYEAVHELLLWGADPNVMDVSVMVHSISPLHLCVAESNAHLIPLLAAHKANLSLQDSKGRTPLHRSVELRNKEIIQGLLKQGANPNIKDTGQTTPLLLACSIGYTEVVGLLCEYGADLKETNIYGQTCLHLATEGGHLGVLQMLLERCGEKSQLLHAQDLFRQTVLHEAAKQVNHQFVEELLCRGCSTETKDAAGMWPLHVAARCGGYQTVLKLAEVAPDVNVKSPDGKTAFYIASEFGNNAAIAALMKLEADVKITDNDFKNSLMAAAIGGFTDVVNDLIQQGVQVNCRDKEDNTALHLACLHGRLATVKTLLDHGACVSSTNIHGQTSLAMAVEKSRSEVVAFLMEHTSWEESLSVPNKTGGTILNKMIQNTPAAVKIVLDKCVKTSDHSPEDEEYAIEFNYKYINTQHKGKSAPECVFVTMLNCGREELLSHPLCQSNFSYKWNTFGKAAFLAHALIQLGFLASLTLFYWFMPKPHDDNYKCKALQSLPAHGTNHTQSSSNLSDLHNVTELNHFMNHFGRPEFRFPHMFVIQIFLCAFMVIQLAKDVYTCFAVGLKYVKSVHFTTQTVIFLLVTSACIPPGYELCDNEWRSITYALFIFFVKTAVTCQRLDGVGVVFTMFIEVAKTMLKISFLMLFFIPAFAIPLSVMVNQEGFSRQGISLFSAFAMALGELNFRDTFVMTDNGPFSTDLYLMFPIICLLLNCSLMNLMIGVAVGDISKVEKTAYLSRLRAHIDNLIEAEQLLFPTLRRKMVKNKLVVRPNTKSKSFNDKVMRTFLYCEQINFIKKNTESSSLTEQERALSQELANQKASLEKLTKTTDDILNALKKINCTRFQGHADDFNTVPTSRSVHIDNVSNFI